LRSLAGQANQEFFFIRIKAKPNKNTKIPTYIMITSLVVVSGSSICSSSVNDDYKINNPYKDIVDTSIKKTMKQVGYFMVLAQSGSVRWRYKSPLLKIAADILKWTSS
jgi:hypothetical protein